MFIDTIRYEPFVYSKNRLAVMEIEAMFQQVPAWLFYAITVVIVLFSFACGVFFGPSIQKEGAHSVIESVVAAMFVMLALILALTFSLSASRFDNRKQVLLDEVNAIGTAFLRTDFLSASQRTASRKLLKEYVDIRVEAAALQNEKILIQLLVDSEAIHNRLWSQINTLPKQDVNSVLLGLYIQSLNDIIDIHSKRSTIVLQHHIPWPIWVTLFIVTMMTMMGVGYQFKHTKTNNWVSILLLAFSFSAVITLIEELDRTSSNLLTVSQKPMIDFQKKLSTSDL